MNEQWRPIPSFPDYSTSNWGRVRSEERRCSYKRWGKLDTRRVPGKVLAQNITRKGYRHVKVALRPMQVHRLVLEAFVGPCPEGMQARHLNGDPGDNRLPNLAWGWPMQNAMDREFHEMTARGESNGKAKLDERKVALIRRATGHTAQLARWFRVSRQAVLNARTGMSWRHVPF